MLPVVAYGLFAGGIRCFCLWGSMFLPVGSDVSVPVVECRLCGRLGRPVCLGGLMEAAYGHKKNVTLWGDVSHFLLVSKIVV